MKDRTGDHIPFLDHLRGIAILLVFFLHSLSASLSVVFLDWNPAGWLRTSNASWWLLLESPGTVGWVGVSIFFVVSGFCIHLSHRRSREKGMRIFFLRRFFRIYPPYLASLLFFSFVYPFTRIHFHASLVHHDYTGFVSLMMDFLSHLFLVNNVIGPDDINFSYWSIAVEVQLYALYPLLIWITSRWGWGRALWITAGIEFSLRLLEGCVSFYPHAYDTYHFCFASPLSYWFSWSIGAALAEAFLEGKPLPFRTVPLLAGPLLFVACHLIKPLAPLAFPCAALTTACVVARLLRTELVIPTRGLGGALLNALRWTGVVSYSLYLFHQPLVNHIPHVISRYIGTWTLAPTPYFSLCVLTLPFIVGLSTLCYYYLELPSIAWGKNLIRKQRSSSSSVATA